MKPASLYLTLAATAITSAISLLLAAALSAQTTPGNTLSGRVVDETTGLPIENANVFLAQTILGTSTDEQGNFRITRIPPGTYRVVISRVGYRMQTQPLTVGQSETFWREFNMVPRELQAEEIQVSANAPTEWKKNLAQFTEKFLGTSHNASYCRIENPEVLTFRIDSISRDLLASSDELIRVENRALGYRVSIALGLFSWDLRRDQGQYLIYPEFEPLQTVHEDSALFWSQMREENYNESLQHFLRSLIAGTLEKEHYEVNIGTMSFLRSGSRHGIEKGEVIVQPTDLWGTKRVMFNDWLMVEHYSQKSKVVNYLTLDQGVALVDSLGNPSDPMSVHTVGPWQDRRVADMLPLYWTQKHAGGE